MPRARVQPRPAGLKLSRDRLSPGRHDGTGRPPRPPQLVLSVSFTYSAILHAPTYRSQPVACRQSSTYPSPPSFFMPYRFCMRYPRLRADIFGLRLRADIFGVGLAPSDAEAAGPFPVVFCMPMPPGLCMACMIPHPEELDAAASLPGPAPAERRNSGPSPTCPSFLNVRFCVPCANRMLKLAYRSGAVRMPQRQAQPHMLVLFVCSFLHVRFCMFVSVCPSSAPTTPATA